MTSQLARRSALAGVLISIGCMFSMAAAPYGPVVQGLCFSVGLFGVLACDARLFTGGVLSVTDLWDHRIDSKALFKQWAITYAFNAIGAFCAALMAHRLYFDAIGISSAKAALPWHELMIRAALCNVMVCMAVYAARKSAHGAADVMAACLLPVACFVACGWEHSVADMLYMSLGAMQGAVTVADCLRVVALATVGNVIGGVAFARLVWDGDDDGR